LPVYDLSFFRAPSGIISSIEYLLYICFGEGERSRGKFLGLVGGMYV
jgi:hypothetical protein